MNICLMEMDSRLRQSMALVLNHRSNGSITLTDLGSADVVVLDLDHENALQTFREICSRWPALRAVGLTVQPDQAPPDILPLAKPISAGRLLGAIQRLAEEGVAEEHTSKVPAVHAAGALSARTGMGRRRSKTAPNANDDIGVLDPDAYLLGTLMKAASEAEKRDAVAAVGFYRDKVILIDARAGLVHSNLSAPQTRAFALSVIDGDPGASTVVGLCRPEVEYMSRAEVESRYGGKVASTSQESFMWTVGKVTSRGRLPAGIRPDERVDLRRWPNMTRIPYSENDMRIIAYWVRRATSPEQIVTTLGVPEREVSSVYAAAYAAGLLGSAASVVDGDVNAPPKAGHQKRGLFSSIMARLLQRKPVGYEKREAVEA